MIKISEIMTTAPTDKRSKLEADVFKTLDKLKIPYERVDNDEVNTMEECILIDEALGTEIRKTIFLTNQKKTSFFLFVTTANKAFDTGEFCKKVGCSRVSFASPELMEKHLGVSPGNATIMGLINDEDDYVQLVIDKEVADAEWFGCNTGANTCHIKIKTKQLLGVFLPHIRHNAKLIEM